MSRARGRASPSVCPARRWVPVRHDTWASGGPGPFSRSQVPGGSTTRAEPWELGIAFSPNVFCLFSSCSCKKGGQMTWLLMELLTASDVWRKNFFAGRPRPREPLGELTSPLTEFKPPRSAQEVHKGYAGKVASPQSQGHPIADGQGLVPARGLQSPKTLVLSLRARRAAWPLPSRPLPWCLGLAQVLSWRLRSCSSAHGGPVINKPSVGQVIKFYPSCIASVTTGWGCPELGPPEPAHQGQRPGQPRFPQWGPQTPGRGLCSSLLRPGPAWTQATEGAGPIPPARSQQLFTNPKPGEAKWLRPEWLQAPQPPLHPPRGPLPRSA